MRRLITAIVAGCGLALAMPGGSLATLDRSRRDPRDDAGHSSQLPHAFVPGRQSHDRLPSQGRSQQQHRGGASRRHDRRLDDHARQAHRDADQVLQRQRGRRRRRPAIAILRAQKSPKLTYKLISQSPVVPLEKYFGKTAQFPLATTLPSRRATSSL